MTTRLFLALTAALFAPFALFAASDTTVPAGKEVDLSVTFTPGNPAASTFQWQKDGAPIAGATNQTLSITSFAAANAGVYSVTVSNLVGSTLSDTAKLILAQIAAPVITTQPLSQTFKLNGPINLSVVATGTNLTYQWYKDGVLIVGATSPTSSTSTGAASQAGVYTVIVTNAGGSVTSAPAVVTLGVAPSGAVLKITVGP